LKFNANQAPVSKADDLRMSADQVAQAVAEGPGVFDASRIAVATAHPIELDDVGERCLEEWSVDFCEK